MSDVFAKLRTVNNYNSSTIYINSTPKYDMMICGNKKKQHDTKCPTLKW